MATLTFDVSRGLCTQTNSDSFFQENDPSSVERSKSICRVCPVRNECAEFALSDASLEGVWGAMTTEERRRLRRNRRRTSA